MPLSDVHKKKRLKNFIFLGMIAAWVALIWAITMIKMANG